MPFVKKTDSKGSQTSIDDRKVFVGRNIELQFFRENILKPKDPTYNIVGSPSFRVKLAEKSLSVVGLGKKKLPSQQEDKRCQASIPQGRNLTKKGGSWCR
jgi:hypothetical protein